MYIHMFFGNSMGTSIYWDITDNYHILQQPIVSKAPRRRYWQSRAAQVGIYSCCISTAIDILRYALTQLEHGDG